MGLNILEGAGLDAAARTLRFRHHPARPPAEPSRPPEPLTESLHAVLCRTGIWVPHPFGLKRVRV